MTLNITFGNDIGRHNLSSTLKTLSFGIRVLGEHELVRTLKYIILGKFL